MGPEGFELVKGRLEEVFRPALGRNYSRLHICPAKANDGENVQFFSVKSNSHPGFTALTLNALLDRESGFPDMSHIGYSERLPERLHSPWLRIVDIQPDLITFEDVNPEST